MAQLKLTPEQNVNNEVRKAKNLAKDFGVELSSDAKNTIATVQAVTATAKSPVVPDVSGLKAGDVAGVVKDFSLSLAAYQAGEVARNHLYNALASKLRQDVSRWRKDALVTLRPAFDDLASEYAQYAKKLPAPQRLELDSIRTQAEHQDIAKENPLLLDNLFNVPGKGVELVTALSKVVELQDKLDRFAKLADNTERGNGKDAWRAIVHAENTPYAGEFATEWTSGKGDDKVIYVYLMAAQLDVPFHLGPIDDQDGDE